LVKGEGYGEEGEWGGEAAARDVRVHQHEGGAGDGEHPEDAQEAEARELRGLAGGAALEEFKGGKEGQPDAEEVGEKEGPWKGEMGEMDDGGEGGGEERKAEVLGDEGGVVGEEGGVEGVLNACDVEAAVFGEGVIALDEKGSECESD
jgi:hypothetical protein